MHKRAHPRCGVGGERRYHAKAPASASALASAKQQSPGRTSGRFYVLDRRLCALPKCTRSSHLVERVDAGVLLAERQRAHAAGGGSAQHDRVVGVSGRPAQRECVSPRAECARGDQSELGVLGPARRDPGRVDDAAAR